MVCRTMDLALANGRWIRRLELIGRDTIVVAENGAARPSTQIVKRLFALSSNRCAFRRCTTPLVQGHTVIGEICHIKAAHSGGPRYDPNQTDVERHSFDNLILMCGVHHKIIDDDEEAYTAEHLMRRKAEHEASSSFIDDGMAERATKLLIQQTVSSSGQSGGITAHTVNTNISFQTFIPTNVDAGAPNWTLHDLFYYLRPNISPSGPSEIWDEVGHDVLDKLSSKQLYAWGREIVGNSSRTRHNLGVVDPSYWRTARFNYVFLLDGHGQDVHATQADPSMLPDLADLHVSREAAIKLWPHPMRGRWKANSFALAARYMNSNPDQATLGCISITLYDANVETVSPGGGRAPYQQMVTPAYILATGIDTAYVQSLDWQPQELSFSDPETKVSHTLYLTGVMETTPEKGRAKFYLEPQSAIAPQSISPVSMQQAVEFFNNELNHYYAHIEPVTVLRRGARLLLQVLPTSALDTGRTIDRRTPELIANCFVPEGYQEIDGRPRQDGWPWYQPRQQIPDSPFGLSWWQSRLNWNGYVEIIETLEKADGDNRIESLQGYPLERHIVQTLDRVADGLQRLNIRSPVILRVALDGVLGTLITKSTHGQTKGFERPMIITDPIRLTQMAKPLGLALRPALDFIWHSAGWVDGSPSFEQGDWEGYTNTALYR